MSKEPKDKRYNNFRNIPLYLVAPLVAIFTTPVRLIQSLWDSRVLLTGKRWNNYPGFQVSRSINYCWYWHRARALHRHGRNGICPTLGMGDKSLSWAFYLSLPSIFAYWRFGAALLVMGMSSWLFMHLIWIQTAGVWFTLVVMGLALVSNYFYCNMFGHQNYNVVGWMFLPLTFYGLLTSNWPLFALGALFGTMGGITHPFIVYLVSVLMLPFTSPLPLCLALVPMTVKVCFGFVPFLSDDNWKGVLCSIAKAIGLKERGQAKYKRPAGLYPHTLYLLTLCMIFTLSLFVLTGKVPVFFLVVMLVVFLNFSILRFADDQSMHMLILTAATAVTLRVGDPLLLPAYWICVSPIPLKLNFPNMRHVRLVMPRLAPYDISPLFARIRTFLDPVDDGKKVIMAFEDPGGEYSRLMDGQRFVFEPLSYVAGERNVLVLPDLWAIFLHNYKGAPEFWGREPDEVLARMDQWNADYALVYQLNDGSLDSKWEKAGFVAQSRLDWGDMDEILLGCKPYYCATPTWWILEPPSAEGGPA